MKSKFDYLFVFLASLGTAVLLSLLVYLFLNTQETQHTNARLNETHQMLRLGDAVLLDILDIESSARAAVQTGKPIYRAAMDSAWLAVNGDLQRMQALSDGHPAQLLRIDSLRTAVQARLQLTKDVLDRRPDDRGTGYEEQLAIGEGHDLGIQIRDFISEISAAELARRSQGQAQNASTNTFARLILATLVLCVLLIFGLILYSLRKLRMRNQVLEKIATNQRQQSQYAMGLIEASLDPLVVISPLGNILDANQATANITGVTRTQLIGSEFKRYFTDPIKAVEVYEEVFARGFVSNYPLTITDGKLTDVSFNGSVYRDDTGVIVGAVILAHDLTDQKRIEGELNDAIRVAELATGIAEGAKYNAESAMRTAEQAVKAKQQFLSNMSHEIRTPMNAIIGFTKVVLKTDLSTKQREYLTAIKLSGDTLIVLINDILDLAKVDAGKMIFEQMPFMLVDVVKTMLHLFAPKIEEKNLQLVKKFDSRIPKMLLGDPARLNQIILNLVGNAVKFTNKGTITVAAELLAEDDSQATVRFSVTDTGIGISETKLSHIFENFEQASSSTARVFGGTGLGLAIVKQLVEKQGGIVEVKSTVGQGSTFSFILGFVKTNAEAQGEPELEERHGEGRQIRVLVVEDIALNQLLMKTLLDDFGFKHDIADNGKLAIAQMGLQDYDIILMDLQMPEMNGFEATDYIRNTLKSQIPIVALTADVTTADLHKCTAVGMNDYIAKPVDERVLYSKILKLVRRAVVVSDADGQASGEPMPMLEIPPARCINLDYLNQRTKSNPVLMKEMIRLYLQQTPPLVDKMKLYLQDQNWPDLQSVVHKMIPSFSIVGINPEFELMAKRLQEYASVRSQSTEMHELVAKLERVCLQACSELEVELQRI
jgi:PAS domain S-box-containing protein